MNKFLGAVLALFLAGSASAGVPVVTTMKVNEDATLRTKYPCTLVDRTNCAPVIALTCVDDSAPDLLGKPTGLAYSENIRQWVGGPLAASALLTISSVSGDNATTKGWAVSGSGLGNNLTNNGASSGSGELQIIATAGGNSVPCSRRAWSYTVPPVPLTKWNPGIYILSETISRLSTPGYTEAFLQEADAMPNVVGWAQRMYWDVFERNGKGQYDFSALDTLLAMAEENNLHLIVQLQDRSFDGNSITGILPPYLTGEIPEGGVCFKPNNAGVVPKIWLPQIMDRYIAVSKALLNHVVPGSGGLTVNQHPYFEGLNSVESSPGGVALPTSGGVVTCGLTGRKQLADQLKRWQDEVKISAGQNTNIFSNLNSLVDQMEGLVANAAKNHLGVAGPDTVPLPAPPDAGFGTPAQRIVLGYREAVTNDNPPKLITAGGHVYKGEIPAYFQVQSPELGCGKEGDATLAQIDNAGTFYGATHKGWLRWNPSNSFCGGSTVNRIYYTWLNRCTWTAGTSTRDCTTGAGQGIKSRLNGTPTAPLTACPKTYGGACATGGGAAPVTFNAGVVTLNGVGFGTKATAAPYYYNSYDSETTGNTAIQAGQVSLTGDGLMPVVVTDRAYSGTKSMKVIYPSGTNMSRFPRIGHNVSPASTAIYVSQMVYWDVTTGSINAPYIFKWGRGGSNPSYSGTPRFYDTMRPGASGTINGGDTGYVTPSSGTNYAGYTFLGPMVKSPSWKGWHRVEYVYKLSTPGSFDGAFQVIVDGTDNIGGVVYNPIPTPTTFGRTRDAGSSATIQWVMPIFDGLDQYGTGNVVALWQDEPYVDVTLSRVVMCNNVVYSSCTKFATQIPLTWADSQITATLKTPGFSSGETVVFHVFDQFNTNVAQLVSTLP